MYAELVGRLASFPPGEDVDGCEVEENFRSRLYLLAKGAARAGIFSSFAMGHLLGNDP